MPARVSPQPSPSQPTAQKSQPFKALLDEAAQATRKAPASVGTKLPAASARPQATPRPQRAESKSTTVIGGAVASTKAAPATTRAIARTRIEAEAQRLEDVRGHHSTTAQQATAARTEQLSQQDTTGQARVVDQIVRELIESFETRPGGSAATKIANPIQPLAAAQEVPFTTGAGAPQPQPQAPEVRAAQATALIERIDTFVRSQRPALALTLNNSLGARVEIEKLGPGRIALRLVGQNGPPSAESVSRIREALRARGLLIGALSVA